MWVVFTAFIGVFYLVGFGLLIYGVYCAKRSLTSGKWPIAEGKLSRCELVQSSDGDGGTVYSVAVEYGYFVGGKEYSGDQLAFGYSASSHRDGHQAIAEKLKKCDTVDVRYDPFSPETSVLSFGIHRSIKFILIFAVTWLLFVVGFSLLWWTGMGDDSVLLRNLSTH